MSGKRKPSGGRAARVPNISDEKKSGTRATRPSELREDAPPYRVGQKAQNARNEIHSAHSVHSVLPLRFIDLFCGIGGFRLAFERAGARCVFSSDWDRFSRQTYAANFGETPHGDIHAVAVADIPEFDILCGGFPCQPFSLAGVSVWSAHCSR